MDGGAWKAVVHGVTKSQTRLSDFTFTFYFHALEKEMATHSSVLAWRIPGMGEAGGLPQSSMGSHRVGHNWSDLATAAAGLSWCLSGKDSACKAWIGKITWRRAWLPTSVVSSGESHGQRSSRLQSVGSQKSWIHLSMHSSSRKIGVS